jgi:hypothetical protein
MRVTSVLAVVFSSLTAMAQSTAALPVKNVNFDAEPSALVGQWVAQHYASASGRKVLMPAVVRASAQDGSDLEAAKGLGADEVLETSVVGVNKRGGQALLIEVSRKTVDGHVVHHEMMRAASLEEAYGVTQRLAVALWQKSSVEATRSRNNIVESETGVPRRLRSESLLGVRVALIQPVGANGFSPIGSVGFDGRLERERYFLEFGAGILVPAAPNASMRSAYGGAYAELGAAYFVTEGDVALSVGGGVLTRALLSPQFSLNLAPYVQGGVTFSRDSSTRLYADVRIAQNVLPMSFGYSAAEVFPTEVGLQVGIGF